MASVPFTAHFFAERERTKMMGALERAERSERVKEKSASVIAASAVRDDDKNAALVPFFGISLNAPFCS